MRPKVTTPEQLERHRAARRRWSERNPTYRAEHYAKNRAAILKQQRAYRPHKPLRRMVVPDLPGEEWRPCFGYEGWYEVSTLGRVKRVRADKYSTSGRVLRGSPSSTTGYPTVTLCDDNGRHQETVHRLVANTFLGPQPQLHVNHIDGTRNNNRVENLEWVTPAANYSHAHKMGRASKGMTHGGRKLTEPDVLAIRALRGSAPNHVIATRYGVSTATVSHIMTRRLWNHL